MELHELLIGVPTSREGATRRCLFMRVSICEHAQWWMNQHSAKKWTRREIFFHRDSNKFIIVPSWTSHFVLRKFRNILACVKYIIHCVAFHFIEYVAVGGEVLPRKSPTQYMLKKMIATTVFPEITSYTQQIPVRQQRTPWDSSLIPRTSSGDRKSAWYSYQHQQCWVGVQRDLTVMEGF